MVYRYRNNLRLPSFARPLSASLLCVISSTSNLSLAETASAKLEQTIVTAQKREESLQDVPVSIAVVSGEKIANASIDTLEDLTNYLPNIHFTETGFSTQVRVRGIGSDNSQGFEQSVGSYIDGIYYGRAQLFRAPFFDLERVELLRGPQSILFGKNSIAGALNLTSAKPSAESLLRLSYSYEFKHAQQELQGVINGALSDKVNARLAFRDYEEEGYFRNTFKNTNEPQSDEQAFRLSLTAQLSDKLSMYIKAENNEFDTRGRAIETTFDQAIAPGIANYEQTLASIGQPALEALPNFERQYDGEETSDNKLQNLTLQFDYELDDFTLNFVSGYLDLRYDEVCDCDNTPSEIVVLDLGENYSQFSQEIRISSNPNASFDWIAGVFYQSWDQHFYDRLALSSTNLIPSTLSALPGRGALALLSDTGFGRDFDQDSNSWAIFAQATWALSERLRVTGGLRYTEETKDGAKVLDLFTPSTNEPLVDLTAGLIYLNVFDTENEQATQALVDGELVDLPWSGHNVRKTRKESAFTPMLGLEFDLNPEALLYASYTTGFKAGGFDPRSNSVGNFTGSSLTSEENPYRNFEFEEETADAYEIGLKSFLFDGRAELNLALYRTDYEDLQVSQFGGAVDFNVGNAAETRVQGVEIDGRWLVTDELSAHFGLSLLDFEYLDFIGGNCHQTQVPDSIDFNGDGLADTCDYTGKRGVYTPDYTVNLALNFEKAIFNNLRLKSMVDAQFIDSHNVHVNLAPEGVIDSYTYVSANIGIYSDNWSLSLLGKNLLDEYIISYSANSPLSGSIFGTNTFYSMIRRPRTIALEGAVWF